MTVTNGGYWWGRFSEELTLLLNKTALVKRARESIIGFCADFLRFCTMIVRSIHSRVSDLSP